MSARVVAAVLAALGAACSTSQQVESDRPRPKISPSGIKHAASITELESVAHEALATAQTPPSDRWMRA